MTEYEVNFTDDVQAEQATSFLHEMIQDGLIRIQGSKLLVEEKGRPFLRNACVFLMSV